MVDLTNLDEPVPVVQIVEMEPEPLFEPVQEYSPAMDETEEPVPVPEVVVPAGLVLKPFAYLLRHTPIRPKAGTIAAADEQDARERIRRKHGFNTGQDFEVEITPQE